MGNIFSKSKKQQERNVEEVIRGIVEAVIIAFILRAGIGAGIKTALGIELTVGISIVLLHLAWEEFGEPFSGIIKSITGIFLPS